MKTWPIGAVLAVLLLTAIAWAQAQPAGGGPAIPLPDGDRRELEKYLGTGVIGAPVAAQPLGTVTDYFSRSEKVVFTFQSLQGKDAGKPVAGHFAWLQRQEDARAWQFDAGGRNVLFGRATKAGTIELLSGQDREQGVVSRYAPAQPLLVPGLKPGTTRQARIAVSVFDLAKPDRQTHSGSLDLVHTYVGAYSVTVPAGTFDAALLRWAYKGKVGPASISDVQYRFLARGTGVVAMVESVDVSAMLVYRDSTRIARVLVKRD